MFTRPLGMSVVDNPLVDSPYFLQFNIGSSFPPLVADYLLLSTGNAFLLSTNDKLLLSG